MEMLCLLSIAIAFSPLLGAILAGLFGKQIGRAGAHVITIFCMTISTVLSCYVLYGFLFRDLHPIDTRLYLWGNSGGFNFEVGFLIDKLTAMMMSVVTFVSLMIHIYTIGYMHDDAGYQRFFSYISLFTFAMLMLVMSNNFLQLFFGWEAVGLVSYLLIGFWFKKPSATAASLKAFLVNRVGDFGFILGIAGVLYYFGSLNYGDVFVQISGMAVTQEYFPLLANLQVPILTVICICLFIGAMGKSAQVPLHVWLPDSMEGPTPISALIHAATMVTAGVFMVARLSPLFEHSEAALIFIMSIGAITCLFMGILGIVQHDIKRIIAYSTLSQLGYMVAALGASAYAAGIFHLMTHAFFKALLFLGAGSVIIGMHHEQDIRKMGNLKKYMPITYVVMLLGSLSLIGFPGFSGFYSKDLIIETVHLSTLPGANIVYWVLLASVFITALYSFRLFFMVFHTKERMDMYTREHLSESPKVITVPLIILAIPSVIIGMLFMNKVMTTFFMGSIVVNPEHDVLAFFRQDHFQGVWSMMMHGFFSKPFALAMAGVVTAWYLYMHNTTLPNILAEKFSFLYKILVAKYGFDIFNTAVLAPGVRGLGWLFWQVGDVGIIDGAGVNGSAKGVNVLSTILKKLQTGYLYHYAFAMIAGFFVLLVWLAWR